MIPMIKTVIVGAGGQARVVADILNYDPNVEIVGYTDNILREPGEEIFGKPVLGKHSIWPNLLKEGVIAAVVAVGDNEIRTEYFNQLKKLGFLLLNAIHPNASLASNVELGEGITVCSGATINTLVKIGNNCIINTAAIVEHECIVEDNVHIGPGANIAGRVVIKKNSFIGIGSTIREYITIGKNVTIGAGSVVLQDIPDNVMAAGVPAQIKKEKTQTLVNHFNRRRSWGEEL